MNLVENQHGAVMVVTVNGPLTESDAGVFLERMSTLARERMGRVVVDASKIPFADSKGLEAILELSELLGEAGQGLCFCGVTDTLREVLELTALAECVEQYEDASGAVRSFL